MKIASKSPIWHLVRLQGKLKLKNKVIYRFVSFYYVFLYSSISSSADCSGWFRLRRTSRKTFDIVSAKYIFFKFYFGRGCSLKEPPPPPPHWVRQCYSPTWACGWSISPVFHDFCSRWSCEFLSRISHFNPPGKIPPRSLDRTVVSHNAAPVWTWWWELSFPSGNSATVNTVVSRGLVHNTVWGIGLRHSRRQAYFHKTSESREGTLSTWAV